MKIEKTITSQNGEDGIIEYLTNLIKVPNKKFLEFGWGDGIHNMSYNLIIKGWSGVGVDPADCAIKLATAVYFFQEFVTPFNCKKYLDYLPLDTDFFSLDIDSYDYEVSKKLLELNFRPKIACLEINKRFGSEVKASFPYVENPPRKLYHKFKRSGVSISKYIDLWKSYNYSFITLDSSHTNAFFVLKDSLNEFILDDAVLKSSLSTEDTLLNHILENDYWKNQVSQIYKDAI
jgi:hypothetical protein